MSRLKPLPLLAEPVPHRICWECEHIRYSAASPGYSDLTPGYSTELECGRGYWEFDPYGYELRACLTSAERCADFSPERVTP